MHLSRAFEDAGDDCGIKRGGEDAGGAREGKLVDSRGQEAKASTQQPASEREANGRNGVSKPEAVAPGKLVVRQEDARQQWCDKRQRGNQPANKRHTGGELPLLPCKPPPKHHTGGCKAELEAKTAAAVVVNSGNDSSGGPQWQW